ncbi:MAG TPA: efflux transporter outer membrane subunit [Gemmatimonadales bacterium]|jgi:NodT family efflux transporter outer membrane factor (OMF) lipoprotein
MAAVRRPARFRPPFLLLSAAALVGCALKQPPSNDEVAAEVLPAAKLPPGWKAAPVDTTPVVEGWLATFGDPALLALVTEALEQNADLRLAAARVDAATGQLRLAKSLLYPAVDLIGHGGIGLGGDASGLNAVLVRAEWEADLWGRVRYGRAAARAGQGAASADLVYARQSLAGLVAKSWYVIAELRMQARLAAAMASASTQLLDLVGVERNVGTANDEDVALARGDVGTYRDRELQLTQSTGEAVRALEVLLGRYPAGTLVVRDSLPQEVPDVPAGLPSSLVARRPDLVAASQRVASAFYAKRQAVAAKLPAFNLNGSFGAISSEVLELQADFSNPVASLGASLLAPIFHGGGLQAQVDIRTAEQGQAVATYGAAVLAAFQDVENALAAEQILRQRQSVLTQVVAEQSRAVAVSRTRWRVGKSDLLSVVQQRMRLYGAEATLIGIRTDRIVQRINLHLALGGDFVTAADSASAVPGGR